MQKITLLLIILLYGTQVFGNGSPEALEKLTLLLSLKSYSEANEEEKLKTLNLLTSYFKEQESESYNRLYHELLSLDSLTINSLNFWKKCQKDSKELKNKDLHEYQCKKLIPNSITKYSLLQKEIQQTLLPLMAEFEKRAFYSNRGKLTTEMLGYLKHVLSDLKRRISDFKKIETDLKNGDFKEAQKKLTAARALLGA